MYVFKNGQAQYAVSGYSSPFVKSDCSPEVSELKGYKTGIGVVDSNLRVGVVDKVFENGNFSYKVPGYSALFVTNVSQAAHRVDTIGRIRGGVAVIDGNLRVGTALQTFENRYVEYNVPGYSSNFVSRDVSPEVEALGALKRGVIILDEADRVGTIEKVFENSRVWYPVSGYSSNFTSVADQVSPEVAEHSPYDKDRFYSTNGYQVGQIEYFFANGKFALKTVSRHRAISQVLFPEVQKLGDYATGAAVTNSAGQAGRVKMVFENGAVLMEYDFAIGSEKSETRNIALRILPDEPKERKESLHAWLNELGARFMFHRNPEPKEDFSRTAHYTILSSSYDGVKKELLDALNGEYYKGFNQRFNSVAREGVSKFLGGVPQWDAPQPGSGPSEDLPSDLPKVDLDLKNLPKKMPFDKEIKLFVRLTDLSGTSETRIVLVTVGSPIADLVSQSSDPRYALASAKGGYQDLQLKFSINEKYRGTTQPVVFTVTDEQTGQKLFSEETQVKIKRGWAFWKRR